MSKTVDERVVSMQFDNAQFQRNVQETIGTIDKLKKQLNLLDSVKGFENISKSARNVDMSTLSDSVDKVGIRFNALHTIADQALRRITDKALYTGKRIVSALTIDPVKMGLSEYETQIGAIQTILSNTKSKGTTLEDVNGALDELNTYADKTIYNFTEMTRNIGTFTAAGVDLDTSVAAIKGIANLAAVSGSTSQQASTAMYQLSQAMSSGTVRLMDWNSVVNAGMGGQVFQDALKETAKVHGVAIDDIIKKQGSFRESLSEGWLTTEILTETLSKFTGDLTESQLKSMGYTEEQIKGILELGKDANDAATKVKTFSQLMDTLKESAQSGWAQTWEIIIGDFEEARAMWTKVSDTLGGIIGSAAEARNELLENWKVLGGRDDLLQGLVNIFEALKSIIAPISKAFREIFPPMTAERLVKITEGFKNFTERLKLSDRASENLKRTFKGVFAILDIAKTILGAVFKAVGKLLKPFGGLCGMLLEVTAYIGDLLVSFSDLIKNSNVFNAVFETIGSVLGFVIDAVTGFIKLVVRKFACPGFDVLRNLLDTLGECMGNVGKKAEGMRSNFSDAISSMGATLRDCAIVPFFQNLWDIISKVASAIGGFFSKIFGKLGSAVKNAGYDFNVSGFLDFLIHLAQVAQEVIKIGIGAKLYKLFGGLADGTKILEGFKDIGKSIKNVFDGLTGCLAALQANIKSGIIMRIAKALAILAISVIALSLVNPEKLTFAVSAVTIMLLELVIALRSVTGVLEGFGKDSGKTTKDLYRATKSISKIAGALILLAIAIKIMGSMSWEEMTVGLITMTVGLTAMIIALKTLSKLDFDPDKIKSASKAIKQVAMAMIPFAIAVRIMGSMSWKEMGVGLITMTAGLTMMTIAIKALNSGKGLEPKATAKAASAMAKMSVAMLILAASIKIMASMSWEEMGIGLITMTVGLTAMITAIKVLNRGTLQPIKLMLAAAAIQQMSIAMVALAAAIKLIGMLSWKEMAVGLTGMVVGLAAITAALKLLPASSAIKALGLVIVASSMMLLASAITAISLLPMQAVAKGLLIVAASFAVIGAAGYILAPIAGTLISLAASFAIFSVGVLALGAGVVALGAGLAALVVALLAMSASLTVITKSLTKVIEAAIVGFITAIGTGIILLCEILIKGAGRIGEAIVALITTLCQAILKSIPTIVKTVLEMAVGILEGLLSMAPKLIDMLFDLLIKVIDGLAKRLPELISSVMNLLGKLFEGIIDAMNQMDPQILVKGILGVTFIKMFMKTLASIAKLGLAAMKGVLILGVVIAELALVLAAVGAIAQIPGLDWLINEGGKLLQSIGTAIGSFIGGIMGGIAKGATAALPDVAVNLSNFMTNLKPFIDGVSLIDPSVLTSIKTLVSAIVLLTGANLINSITSFMTGGSSIASFGKELSMLGSGLKGFSDAAGDIVPENIEAAANAAKTLTEMCSSIPNSGGLVSWITGDNSVANFSAELALLGMGLKGFSDSAGDINPDAIQAAATAAKTLTEMTASIPDSGGVVAWFAGDNSIANFASDLALLGVGLKGFSDSVAGVNPENIAAASTAAQVLTEMCASIPNSGGVASWFAGDNSIANFAEEIVQLGLGLAGFSLATIGIIPENVSAAATAAKSLADMANTIPNTGGVASWFAGDNSIAAFASELPLLGMGLTSFSASVTGIVPENITAAATAAKALAEMTNTIPNSGGVGSWFAGDNSIAQFANEIGQLGVGLKGFSDSVVNINPEAVTAAANAAKALAEMTNTIPNSGGVGSWFAGDNSLAQFASEIVLLGTGLKGFSDNTAGINPETVSAAANAAKSLAELTQYIPNSGGVASWFAGEVSLSKFSGDIALLGTGLKGFSDATTGINPEAVSAAANAAKSLAEMTQYVPNSGGVGAWFTGEVSLSKFSTDIALLGVGLKGFSDATTGIVAENIVAAANAAKALAEMTQYIPNSGGVVSWFTGETSISNFAGHLPKLGEGLKGFSDSVEGINPENLTAAAKAAKAIAEMTGNTLGNVDKIPALATNLGSLGTGMKQCFAHIAGISKDSISRSAEAIAAIKKMGDVNASSVKTTATAIEDVTKAIQNLSKVPKDAASGFNQAMKDLGNTSADSLLKEFKDIESDMKTAGEDALDSFVSGFESKLSAAKKAAKSVANSAADAIGESKTTFTSAGGDLVDGFASGISANSYKAAAKARAMAQAAAQAAKDELDINSPSKVFREIGYSIPEGLAAGIDKMGSLATDSAESMATNSVDNVKDTLYRISDAINGDMDMQPTIRPVLDLSDVQAGANSINGLFGRRSSVGVMANVNAISSSMGRRSQNGEGEQVVSELTKLRKELANKDSATYNFNGMSFTGNKEVEEAFETILRAAKMGGRM